MTFFNRLKDRFRKTVQQKAAPARVESSVVPPLATEVRPLTRVEQNLAWLPVYEAPKPLSLPLPACPEFSRDEHALRNRYEAYIEQAENIGAQGPDEAFRETGRQLASDFLSRAMDYSSSKALEFSHDIYWFLQCAAVVSLFADGAKSTAFLSYQEDVHHYRDGRLTQAQVFAFDAYVSEHTSEDP